MLIKYNKIKDTMKEKLLACGTPEDLAERASIILTDNTCDGVASHGVNRFARILEYVDMGHIKVSKRAEVISSFGALEVVDGKQGLGMTNAQFCMDRAISIAKEFGIGCVAMKNNNHWMRGATYGIQAANANVIGICFTNTLPNMPPWGAKNSRIGNNPLVIAVPSKTNPVVLDMAMSQFSYGKLGTHILEDKPLPLDGGYDAAGNLTKDPNEIMESGRILPMGFWKGSGLSIVLDLLATILSGGLSTKEISNNDVETAVSQVFIAIDPEKNNDADIIESKIKETIEYIKAGEPIDSEKAIYYPGKQSAMRRKDNKENGIEVNDEIWSKILSI